MKSNEKVVAKANGGNGGGGGGDISNFEDILERLGGFGRFQLFVLVSFLYFEIPIAFTQFLQVFVGASPDFYTCGNETRSLAGVGKFEVCTCNETVSLDQLTIVGEWNLICAEAWVSDFLTSVQMVGMLLGNMIGSPLADWYGRRYCFLTSLLFGWVGTVISAAAPNPYVYACGRLCCGIAFSWYMGVAAIYTMEFMPTKYRQLAGCVGPFGEGTMLLGLLGYLIRPWRTLTWVTTSAFFALLGLFPFIPESPRWLMQQKKLKEFDRVLRYMAKVNKTEPIRYEVLEQMLRNDQKSVPEADAKSVSDADGSSTSIEIFHPNSPQQQQPSKFDKVQRSSYLDLFRPASVCKTTVCLMTIWFAWSMSYFGVTYNVKNMDGSRYLNLFYLGLADRIGYTAAWWAGNRLGRCNSLMGFMSFGAFCYVTLAILLLAIPTAINESYTYLIGLLCIIGKLGLAGARCAARTLTGESYATNVRIMGIGMSGISASVAAVLAPQLAYLGTKWPSVPYFGFAAITIMGSLSSFLMTETKGKPMTEGGEESGITKFKNAIRRVSVSSILTPSRKMSVTVTDENKT